jgi:hypothetical protein
MRTYNAAPISPKNRPITEAPYDAKLKKRFGSTIRVTIRNGATKPNNTRKKPMRMIFQGCSPLIGTASTP